MKLVKKNQKLHNPDSPLLIGEVKDGDVVGTATLNASNNWSVSFKDLPVYSNGQLINYSYH